MGEASFTRKRASPYASGTAAGFGTEILGGLLEQSVQRNRMLGVEHGGAERDLAVGSRGVEACPDFFDRFGHGVEHRQAESRVTQPRQQRGGTRQAAETVGGFDQRQIPSLIAVSMRAGVHAAASASFGHQDHHFPAEPLGEKAIAIRQRQERGTREQAGELDPSWKSPARRPAGDAAPGRSGWLAPAARSPLLS